MKKPIAVARIRFAVLTILFAGLAAYLGQPLVSGNEKAIDLVVNVFSILAGFLVAIIAVVGDPALLPAGSWRAAEMSREKMRNRLIRYKWLFVLYLFTLALIFLSLLLGKAYPELTRWVEIGFIFMGIVAFTYSLRLPTALIAAQQEKIDMLIEQRRRQAGISDSSASQDESLMLPSVPENDL